MELRLTGQLLVIGGARGIGAEVVRVASASGAKVAWTCTGGPAGCAASESLVRDIPGATWRAIDLRAGPPRALMSPAYVAITFTSASGTGVPGTGTGPPW